MHVYMYTIIDLCSNTVHTYTRILRNVDNINTDCAHISTRILVHISPLTVYLPESRSFGPPISNLLSRSTFGEIYFRGDLLSGRRTFEEDFPSGSRSTFGEIFFRGGVALEPSSRLGRSLRTSLLGGS